MVGVNPGPDEALVEYLASCLAAARESDVGVWAICEGTRFVVMPTMTVDQVVEAWYWARKPRGQPG